MTDTHTEALVERVARALYEVSAETEHGETWESLSDGWKDNFRTHARAAIEALPARNDERALKLAEALRPFAECVSQIKATEDDEEWAKFRLLVKDYRRAAKALDITLPGLVRCAACGGEFDEAEWADAPTCPECEQPKRAAPASQPHG
jgi:predicted Zn-ribbon and HTH transcriptional regulator